MTATTNAATRADDVYARLRADILTGGWSPGQRLKFPDLCRRYGTSVGAAREALTMLKATGLVDTQPHLGFTVAILSAADLGELARARAEIESLVLRLSVREGDTRWEADGVAAMHVLERTPFLDPQRPGRSTPQWTAAHAAFHEALLAGCGNRRLRDAAGSMRDEAELYRQWSILPGIDAGRDLAAEHRALLDAAVARDADRAADLLYQHIDGTGQLALDIEPAAG